jgi:hypothetical protein
MKPSNRRFATAALVIVISGIQSLASSANADDDLGHLDKIVASWQTRQNTVRTLRAEWVEVMYNAADGSDQKPVGQVEDQKPVGQVVILTVGSSGESRLEMRPPVNPTEREGDTPDRSWTAISSFNGSRNFQFTSPVGSEDWPRGIIWSDEKDDEIHNCAIRPWLLHFRPFHSPVPNLSKERLQVVTRDSVVNGRTCTVLETIPSVASGLVEVYWVDIERRSSIVRFIEKFQDKATVEINIEHQEEPDIGWIPSAWNAAFVNGQFSIRSRLLKREINPDLSKADFELTFPAGTIVFDRDLGYRELRLENGKTRIITREESAGGFKYNDLFTTESGELAPTFQRRSSVRVVVLIVGNLVVILGVALFLFFRQKRQQ